MEIYLDSKRFVQILGAVICLLFYTGCKEEPLFSDVTDGGEGTIGGGIAFKAILVGDDENGSTKGIPVNGPSYPDGASFGVLGYRLPDGSWKPTLSPDFMYNRQVTRMGDRYAYEGLEYWPASRIRFFAYHPYANTSNGVQLSGADFQGSPFIRFSVNDSVTRQVDLLLSAPESVLAPASLTFPFTHALTRIAFTVRKSAVPGEITISSITLKNIIGKGTVSMFPLVNGHFVWTPSTSFDDVKEYTLAVPSPDGVDRGLISPGEQQIVDSEYRPVCSPNGTLFLIPQQITQGRSLLIVRYALDGEERTQEVLLPSTSAGSDNEWLSGKFIRYQLTIDVKEESEEVIISVADGNANCILLNPSPQQNPSAKFIEYSIPITQANHFYTDPAFVTWNEGQAGISASDSWGVNVIWMDKANLLTITKRYGRGVEDTSEGRFKVRIPVGSQGNALVGIYKDVNKNEIRDADEPWIWSWHLWVTDYDPNRFQGAIPTLQSTEGEWEVAHGKVHRYRDAVSISDPANNNADYGALDIWKPVTGLYAGKVMMDRNVGSISADFPPLENGIPFETATKEQRKTSLHVLYYEYGRKDPFLSDAYRYQENGTALNTIDFYSRQVTLLFSIQNPEKYIHGRQSWAVNKPSGSYWYDPRHAATLERSEQTGKKSLFDPCPAGWRLPVNGTWSDFNRTTFLWENTRLGRVYRPENSILTVYYPAEGFRAASTGEVKQTGYHGIYWTCSPIPVNDRDYCFRFTSPFENVLEGTVFRDIVYPSAAVFQTDSFSVRCVQE